EQALRASGQAGSSVVGPLDPGGVALSPARVTALHAQLGDPRTLSPVPPAGSPVTVAEYNTYRSISRFVSPDGLTVQLAAAPLVPDTPPPTRTRGLTPP